MKCHLHPSCDGRINLPEDLLLSFMTFEDVDQVLPALINTLETVLKLPDAFTPYEGLSYGLPGNEELSDQLLRLLFLRAAFAMSISLSLI